MNLGKPSTQLRSKRKTIVDDSSSDNAPTEETSTSKCQKKTHEEV
jgi:hypothetical protein